MKKYGVILAAGKGTRMKSLNQNKSKVAFEILGKPLVGYVLDNLNYAKVDQAVVVAGFGGEETKRIVESRAKVVFQKTINGTAKAVESAAPILKGKKGTTIVMCGDTPLIKGQTIEDLFLFHEDSKNDMTVATMVLNNPAGYGRIIRNDNDEILKIVEQKDASIKEQEIKEVNSGLYIFNNELLFEYLKEIKPNNKQKEYYLTDIVNVFIKHKKKTGAFIVKDYTEMYGINDRKQLAIAGKIIQFRVNEALMLSGVTIEDSETTYISTDATIGQDTIIGPNTSILGNSVIGKANIIGPNSYLNNVKLGDNNKIATCYLENFECGNDNKILPFAKVKNGKKIGNGKVIK